MIRICPDDDLRKNLYMEEFTETLEEIEQQYAPVTDRIGVETLFGHFGESDPRGLRTNHENLAIAAELGLVNALRYLLQSTHSQITC